MRLRNVYCCANLIQKDLVSMITFAITMTRLAAFFVTLIMCTNVLALSPSDRKVTIFGNIDGPVELVSLFIDANHPQPIKTVKVNNKTHTYSIEINLEKDLSPSDVDFFADLRFWNDLNGNGVLDKGEPKSRCHFIVWDKNLKQLHFEEYKGKIYPIESDNFKYDFAANK